MKYRPEIDGLRALAVVAVVFFHVKVPYFEGGFVGVDIFFVISGFLITKIIYSEVEGKNFSITGFYKRRARRILPALYLVILMAIVWSTLFQPPFSARDFYQSVFATTAFANNLLLAHESAQYFDLSSDFKPLLHTWSLGIEEQFYIVFPFFFLLVSCFGRFFVKLAIAVALVLSLAAYVASPGPISFYMPHLRGWELLSGSLVAIILHGRRATGHDGLATLGCLLVFGSILSFGNPHLILLQVAAVLGTVLVILFCKSGGYCGRLLGARPLVGIGLISYSLYLWHQPLLAFARIRLGPELPVDILVMLLLLTLVIAYSSWRFIETPFRSRNQVSSRALIVTMTIATAFFMLVAVPGHFTTGFERLKLASLPTDRAAVYVSHFEEQPRRQKAIKEQSMTLAHGDMRPGESLKRFLVIGDSMGGDMMMTLGELVDEERTRVDRIEVRSTCLGPILEGRGACGTNREALFAATDSADLVILAADWAQHRTAVDAVNFYRALRARDLEVSVVGALRFRHFSDMTFEFAQSSASLGQLGHFVFQQIDPRTHESNTIFKAALPAHDYIDKFQAFCDPISETCRTHNNASEAFFFDALHMTVEGGEFFAEKVDFSGHTDTTRPLKNWRR